MVSLIAVEVSMKKLIRPSMAVLAVGMAGLLGSLPVGLFAQYDGGMSQHQTVAGTTRSMAEYVIPQIQLVRDDGKKVSLSEELNDGRPVVMSFIFTTCTTICPLMTQTLANFQSKLGADRDRVHIVSISIDPEQDTPARLTEYARRFKAGPEWQHYTGTVEASLAAQRAFNVYRGDKMGHAPVTLFRSAPGKPWLRIDGFTTAEELVAEIRKLGIGSSIGGGRE
jgi:protein SCO1